MDTTALTNGLTLMANGAMNLATQVTDWRVLAGTLMVIAMIWLARLEIDEVDLAGAKPYLPRG